MRHRQGGLGVCRIATASASVLFFRPLYQRWVGPSTTGGHGVLPGDSLLQHMNEKTKVFISYSRRDTVNVQRISSALQQEERFQVFRDTQDILPTEEWRKRLERLIVEADTVVFCLSPHSAVSDVCAWEVALAERLGKRIAPVLLSDVDSGAPEGLSRRNYIRATDSDNFEQAMKSLVVALDMDINWIREHTRLGELAQRWHASGRRTDQLLRGRDLEAAEQWARFRPSSGPVVTDITERFIGESRAEAVRSMRRSRRILGLIGMLAISLVGIASLAYGGFLDPVYLEGRVNALRNLMREPSLRVGDVVRDCAGTCPEMIVLPTGTFVMGSGNDPTRSVNERPQHRVTIAKHLLVSRFEVTFEEWDACIADGGCTHRPSDEGWGRGRRPVVHVSSNDVDQYLTWLSKKTGMAYRLLSEAEWEFAARGTRSTDEPWTEYFWGNEPGEGNARCDGCGGDWEGKLEGKSTAPVGSYKSNAFGLHDMHGNVWEWVRGCWVDDYANARADGEPQTVAPCSSRVLRGGSWVDGPRLLRSAYRFRVSPGSRTASLGFRVARELAATPAK